MLLSLKHILRLLRELALFSLVNRSAGLPLLVLLLLAVGGLIFVSHAAAPLMYTIF